jgi:hypothetical protein
VSLLLLFRSEAGAALVEVVSEGEQAAEASARPLAQVRVASETEQASDAMAKARALSRSVTETVQAISVWLMAPFQFCPPTTDLSDGGWTASDASGNLAVQIDEMETNDADYIQSSANPSGDVCLLDLEVAVEPTTGTVEIVIRHSTV